MRFKALPVILFVALAVAMGCSNGTGPLAPVVDQPREAESGHQIWGLFEITWDGVSDELTVIANRTLNPHFDVTAMVAGNVKLTVTGWNPITRIMTVKAELTNPTSLTGYDVRGVLFKLGAKKLINADDYTKLFDTNIPPEANPFKAFAKDVPNREFAPAAKHEETFQIYLPAEIYVMFMVTAAWPDNAPEPYDIGDIKLTGDLYENTGSLDLSVEVLDWQDTTASDVILEANPVTGGDLHLTQSDATHWSATIENTAGAAQGNYEAWIAAYDAVVPYALYNKITIKVGPPISNDWSPPIIIDDEAGVDKILPRVILRDSDYWIIYTDETDILARQSTDDGYTWSAAMTVGTYGGTDTIHAVLGGDNAIYVMWQASDAKYTYISKWNGSDWEGPAENDYHGMTLPPYSCDLGVDDEGYIYFMTTGDWSTFGFRSTNPYDISDWLNDPIESFYNGVYSINDGFVQNVETPKFFFVHEEDEMDYAWYDGGWDKAAAMTGMGTLIEPAIAPEVDGPWHGVVATYDGVDYDLVYFRYDAWPPVSAHTVELASGLTEIPTFHSLSVEGGTVSLLYDADGDVRYVESSDGGDTFGSPETLSTGSMFSHIRRDFNSSRVVAAYSKEEGDDWNIYIRLKG